MLRVAIVDGDKANRQNLCLLLDAAGIEYAEFADPKTYLKSNLTTEPHVAVINLSFKDFDGLDILRLAIEQTDALASFATLDEADTEKTVAAMRLGAVCVFDKPVKADVIIGAASGKNFETGKATGVRHVNKAQKDLSAREKEILKRLLTNCTNKIIASELDVSVRTVQTHRARIYAKLGVSSQAELIRKWTV